MPTKTDWFEPGVKPVHVGVYETRVLGGLIGAFQYWDGAKWGLYKPTVNEANTLRCSRSYRQNPEWRGLTQKAGD